MLEDSVILYFSEGREMTIPFGASIRGKKYGSEGIVSYKLILSDKILDSEVKRQKVLAYINILNSLIGRDGADGSLPES